jgi:hypothetical protein
MQTLLCRGIHFHRMTVLLLNYMLLPLKSRKGGVHIGKNWSLGTVELVLKADKRQHFFDTHRKLSVIQVVDVDTLFLVVSDHR